ncbi:unnamed protein product [Rotaria sordida]|uniref:Tetratricopeptide repeat protein n=1 Tax=Rotaria sordida TaxID=392033 RepID=A0A815IQQ8_9BILA|nr:unnamed protein product [Rotaria sordida]
MNRYIAEIYSSIGQVYLHLKDYENALYYKLKALEIRKLCLPFGHVIGAFSYADIAEIFWHQKKYEQALKYHIKALELRQKYLLPDHLDTAWSLHYVGKMYYTNGDKAKALDYYLKSLDMTKKCQPPSQRHTVPEILQDIAVVYDDNLADALKYRFKALEAQKNTEPINYSYLIHILETICSTYKLMGREGESLKFYQEALHIQQEYLSNNEVNTFHDLDD